MERGEWSRWRETDEASIRTPRGALPGPVEAPVVPVLRLQQVTLDIVLPPLPQSDLLGKIRLLFLDLFDFALKPLRLASLACLRAGGGTFRDAAVVLPYAGKLVGFTSALVRKALMQLSELAIHGFKMPAVRVRTHYTPSWSEHLS